jgi:hypothetical protein
LRYPHLRSTRFNRHTQLPEHVPRADTSPYAPPVPVLTCEPHHESNTYHGAIEANTTIPPPPRATTYARVRVRHHHARPAPSVSVSVPVVSSLPPLSLSLSLHSYSRVLHMIATQKLQLPSKYACTHQEACHQHQGRAGRHRVRVACIGFFASVYPRALSPTRPLSPPGPVAVLETARERDARDAPRP